MSVDRSLTTETFNNGVRTNGFILNNNKYYNNSGSGISDCTTGSPTRAGANVLCNCVGLAWGAYNETWNKCDSSHTGFKRVRGDAHKIIETASSDSFFKNYVLPVTSRPPEGGLIVWTDQHVAYIAKVNSDDSIVIVQSGYDYGDWTLSNNAGTGWCNDTRTITRNEGGPNKWYYHNGCGCLGFLANPGVVKRDAGSVTPDPDPEPPVIPDPPVNPDPDPPVVATKYGAHIGGQFYGAHIYTSSGWKRATPMIWNGSKWVKCKQ